jgi:hypothetical protein
VTEEVDWLVTAARDRTNDLGRMDQEFFARYLDYQAEDRYLNARAGEGELASP